MDAKFGFSIKFYARIQIFRLLGPIKLFLWLFKITRFFKNYMVFPYENNFSPKFIFLWRSHIKISENGSLQTAVKVVRQVVLTQNFASRLISFDAESEFGIHFVSGSTVTTSLVLMSRTDFENKSQTAAD